MRTHVAGLALAAALAAFVPAACGRPSSGGKWASHTGDVKFVIGWEKGRAAADVTKKPLAIFLTADW